MRNVQEPFFKKADRVLLVLCLLGLLLTGAILNSEKLFYILFGNGHNSATTAQIGLITFYSNDTRYKSFGSLAWQKAAPHETIHIGDSVFTSANSTATVKLNNANNVTLGQNSMVTFESLNNIEVPNFAVGNFQLKVNGGMTVSIAGHVRELQGTNGEVQIYIRKGRPVIRKLKGHILIGDHNGFQNLNTLAIRSRVPASENEDAILELSTTPEVHVWQVSDLFAPTNGSPSGAYSAIAAAQTLAIGSPIRLRTTPRAWVNLMTNVNWLLVGSPKKVYGELSENQNFTVIKDDFSANADDLHAQFHVAHIGENYVHLSVDHKKWSATQSFLVNARYLNESPKVNASARHIYLFGPSAETTLTFRAPQPSTNKPFRSFIVEMTKGPRFSPAQTRALWIAATSSGTAELRFYVHHPGIYFFRAHGVNGDQQLSAPSNVVTLIVERPGLPAAPILSSNEIRMSAGQSRIVSWAPVESASRYRINLVNAVNGQAHTITLNQPDLRLAPKEPGIYNLKIASVDRFGRPSSNQANVRLIVSPQPLVVQQLAQRAPASINSMSMSYEPGYGQYRNENVFRSYIDAEAGELTMYSRDLAAVSGQVPTSTVLGVHWLNWFGTNGFGGDAFLKVASIAQPAGSSTGNNVSPVDVSVRYERRWRPTINLFSFFSPIQLALNTGIEVYKNETTGGYYSPGYTLAELGGSIAIPLFAKWATGGDLIYGQNFDSTTMYEGNLFADYFYQKNWSLGFGYRIRLMQAGSTSEAPTTTLPYREGASEAYSVLKWYY